MAEEGVMSLTDLAILACDELLFFFGQGRRKSQTVTSDPVIGFSTLPGPANKLAPEHSVKGKPLVNFAGPQLFCKIFTIREQIVFHDSIQPPWLRFDS
jgi:hypothetical protein